MVSRLALLCPPVLSWHVLGTFLRAAGLCVTAFLSIYLIVEFFDRFDTFLNYGASSGSVALYFLLRIPMFVTRVMPMAVLSGLLLGLGNLSRHNEFVALRAAGVSIWQVATPLLLMAALISGATLLWSERVMPYCSQRANDIYTTQIKKQPLKNLARQHVWYRGIAGFYNIKRVSANMEKNGLVGLTVYQIDEGFRPRRLIEVDRVTWDEDRKSWNHVGLRAYRLYSDGTVEREATPDFQLPETPDDFLPAPGDVDGFTYTALRQHIAELRQKGADPGEYLVDLHLKLALPFASLVLAMIGIPLATRGTRTSNLSAAVTLGLAIGFSYWIVLAFARALGQSNAVDPVLAAWAANGIFAMLGLFLFLGAD